MGYNIFFFFFFFFWGGGGAGLPHPLWIRHCNMKKPISLLPSTVTMSCWVDTCHEEVKPDGDNVFVGDGLLILFLYGTFVSIIIVKHTRNNYLEGILI